MKLSHTECDTLNGCNDLDMPPQIRFYEDYDPVSIIVSSTLGGHGIVTVNEDLKLAFLTTSIGLGEFRRTKEHYVPWETWLEAEKVLYRLP